MARKHYKPPPCSLWYMLTQARPQEFIYLRTLLSLPVGMMFGFIFHEVIIKRFKYPYYAQDALLPFCVVMLGIAFTVSVQVRCIGALVLPTFLGRSLRSLLITLSIDLLLRYPINNISGNIVATFNSITCASTVRSQFELNKETLIHQVSD